MRNINGDWEKKWADNPQHMDPDFHMLLSVCLASTFVLSKTVRSYLQVAFVFHLSEITVHFFVADTFVLKR